MKSKQQPAAAYACGLGSDGAYACGLGSDGAYACGLGSDGAYRVSTITSVGDLNGKLDLGAFFGNVKLDPPGDGVEPRFLSAKVGTTLRSWMDDASSSSSSSLPLLEPTTTSEGDTKSVCSSSSSKDHFGNQVTLVLSMEGTKINMKAFKNGRVQLTGIKEVDQGFRAIEHLVRTLKTMKEVKSLADVPFVAGGYRVCMINSHFDLGFAVKRDRLFTFVREHFPNMQCTYEPCNYHGVKFKYMWNSSTNACEDGICRCEGGLCAGTADGSDEGKCRKVTVAVFQSGKVIATGAQTTRQLEDAIRFLVEEVCTPKNRAMFRLGS